MNTLLEANSHEKHYEHLLEAHGLVKRYGNRLAVDGIDLVVAPGEVVAIIGPNGAGKSTTLEMILGLTVSNLAQNETQVSMINNIVTLPMMFASEVFYSLSAAPAWVKVVGRIFPLSYLVEGEKAALVMNAPGVVFPTVILLGFTLLALALAVITFRWDPDASPVRRDWLSRSQEVRTGLRARI